MMCDATVVRVRPFVASVSFYVQMWGIAAVGLHPFAAPFHRCANASQAGNNIDAVDHCVLCKSMIEVPSCPPRRLAS
ncbi:hypothetical protein DUNSADRAFT_13898 [Dunaliella salina]|uniref:Encoded protein n=1 Tax=Dunaliella salina TaxID=3046 RepID=A0ABQ7G8H1_DUNSA|nr:hypothetical protein DUNSADRAFT_13898 [Dunaliella salina]|eukprot:KAF5830909.1 hypothetical protein DUNSADRAFT_13898 [Dunaliella salina]